MAVTSVLGAALAVLLAAAEAPAPPPPAPPPPAGQIRGSISYGRHAPAVGAVVVFRPESAPTPVRIATTGSNGGFAFDGVADGTYRAEVRREGFAPVVKSGIRIKAPFRAVVELVMVPGETPKETGVVALDGSASLAGTVRIAGGVPVAEAHVRLTRPDGAADSRTSICDGSGAFALKDLTAGRWRLDVQGAGLLPLRADLDLAGDVAIEVQLAAQPPNYRPLPQDLLVPEDVIPPPDS
jgi:hypothetical protein